MPELKKVEEFIARVDTLMHLVKKLRRDIEFATELMTAEQQATFYEGVKLMDRAVKEYEEE
jgi:hypothetical protein|tara:strand:+ start:411 stop:593 length:183 start_codon:yes stop_codon:yes gene_type:complete